MNCYLWIPQKSEVIEGPQNSNLLNSKFTKVFYPWHIKPKIVWSLIDYIDPKQPPEITNDDVFTARINCFREFPVHDYIYHDDLTYFFFQSRFTNGGHWIMLVF